MRLHAIFMLLSATAGWFLGGELTASELEEIITNLKGSAEVLFGIIGIWLSILFPEVLTKLSVASSINELFEESKKYKRLILPIMTSIVTICFIIGFQVLLPPIKRIDFVLKHATSMKQIGFAVALFGSLELIFSYVISIFPVLEMTRRVDSTEIIKHDVLERDKQIQKR